MQKADRQCRVNVKDGWLETTGTVQAHRAAVAAMLAPAKAVLIDPEKDTRTFSLNPTRAPVKDLLGRFANALGRRCLIHDDAVTACEKIVTIEAENERLVDLIGKVARQAGVSFQWQGDTLVISAGR